MLLQLYLQKIFRNQSYLRYNEAQYYSILNKIPLTKTNAVFFNSYIRTDKNSCAAQENLLGYDMSSKYLILSDGIILVAKTCRFRNPNQEATRSVRDQTIKDLFLENLTDTPCVFIDIGREVWLATEMCSDILNQV